MVTKLKQRTQAIVDDDRRGLQSEWEKEARHFYHLVRTAREKLPNTLFNDWLFTVGMYGSLHERLKIAELVYNEAINDQ